MRLPGRDAAVMLGVFSAALIARVILFLEFRSTIYFENPIMDAAFYHHAAAGFARERAFTGDLFLMSPLYQVFLSGLYSLFGINLPAVYLTQMLLGSAGAVLLYAVAARISGRAVALIASAIYLLYGPLALYNLLLLPVTLVVSLNLALLLALVLAGERDSALLYVLAGLMLGLSAAARANVLLFLLFLVPWFYLHSRNHRKNSGRLACFLLGASLALLPFSIARYRAEGTLNPLTSTMGVNLYLGNNPGAIGIQYIPSPDLHSAPAVFEYSRRAAESEIGKALTPGQVSDFWTRKALDFIAGEPRQSFSLFARKLLLFWNDYEVPNNYNYYFLRRQVPALKALPVGFAFIASLALMAMALNLRRRKRLFLLYGAVLAYNLALVVFFVLSRYRMAAVPFLALFSAMMLNDAARESRPARRVLLACAFVLLFLMLRISILEVDLSTSYVNQGIIQMNEGDYESAVGSLRTAVEIDSGDVTARYNLAVAYMHMNDLARAESHLMAALSIQPRYRKALNALASVYAGSGDYRQAEDILLGILDINPRDLDALTNLGVVYVKTGDYERAEQRFQEALALEPGNRVARENLDRLKRMTGRRAAGR